MTEALGRTALEAGRVERINVVNTYSGSLAYANFFPRPLCAWPAWGGGVLTAVLSTALLFGNIYQSLQQLLTFEAVFVLAWIMPRSPTC